MDNDFIKYKKDIEKNKSKNTGVSLKKIIFLQ